MYTRDLRICTILIPAWGSIWGSLGFSRNQNNRGSSGAYITCMYHDLSMNAQITVWMTAHEDCERVCFAFIFVYVVGKNLMTRKLNPMADEAVTWGGIGGLGSLVYTCAVAHVEINMVSYIYITHL